MKTPSRSLLQNRVALSVKAITIILVTTAIYFQDVTVIANEALQSELMSHILAISFLMAYLLNRKRKMLKTTISFETSNPVRKPTHTGEIAGALLCLPTLLAWLLHFLSINTASFPFLSLIEETRLKAVMKEKAWATKLTLLKPS